VLSVAKEWVLVTHILFFVSSGGASHEQHDVVLDTCQCGMVCRLLCLAVVELAMSMLLPPSLLSFLTILNRLKVALHR
jgi:hypothetical protein